MSAERDLQRWLTKATKGLPGDEAAMLRDELRWHYEDTCEAYRAEGLTDDEAHQATMTDLGAAGAVAGSFREVYRAGSRYLLIALAGLLYPPVHFFLIHLNNHLSGAVVFNLVIFLPLLYIVYGLKTLLAERPHGANMKLYEQVIHTGIAVACVPRLLTWLTYHQPMVMESYSRSLWDTASTFELTLNLVTLLGFFIIALGLMTAGERVLHLRETLYGLLKPAGILLIGMGLCFGIYAVASVMGNAGLSVLADNVIAIVGMIGIVLWSLIFFRSRTEMTIAAV